MECLPFHKLLVYNVFLKEQKISAAIVPFLIVIECVVLFVSKNKRRTFRLQNKKCLRYSSHHDSLPKLKPN